MVIDQSVLDLAGLLCVTAIGLFFIYSQSKGE